MRSKALVLLLGVALAIAPRSAGAFCGFYVSGGDTSLFNNATMVVMMRDGQRTVLSMQNNYQGPPSNFAMVVPVPVVLQKENVKTLPREIFKHIDQLAAPRLVEYWEQDPCTPPPPPMAMAAAGAAAPRSAPMARSAVDLGVTIEAQFTVGEYEIVILSAKDSTGLNTWLKQEKYKIPDGAEPVLRPYVQSGMKFFVAKVDVSKVQFNGNQAMLSPLRFHYDTDKFTLPIRLGLLNSGGTQDLIVHILAKSQRYEVANYANVTIPTNLDLNESARDQFAPFYAALFDETLEKNPRSVVTEYSWDAGTCDPCPTPALSTNELATLGADVLPSNDVPPVLPPVPPPARVPGARPVNPTPPPGAAPTRMPMRRPWGFGNGFVLTRLHVRYGKESLGDDLVFRAAPPIQGGRESMGADGVLESGAKPSGMNNFQGRYAIRHPWTGPVACESPRRGIWGGPPPSVTQGTSPKSAVDLAFAPRGGIQLASFVQKPVPELGLQPQAPPPGAAPTAPTAPTAPVPSGVAPPGAPSAAPSPTSSSSGGSCAIGPDGAPELPFVLGLGFAAAAVVRRRRRG
jgi:hypothetical protein